MRRLAPLVCVLLTLPASAFAAGDVFRPVKGNPADRLVALPIDDYQYDHAKKCHRTPKPGTRALEAWLARNAAGSSWGIIRCELWGKDSASLHAEGRALDWHLDAANRRDRREAMRLINLLLAPDSTGNPHALARRMGVQEIIFDCKAWFSGSDELRPYSACYDEQGRRKARVNRTVAHRDHIHFGLNWAGARMRSTYWAR